MNTAKDFFYIKLNNVNAIIRKKFTHNIIFRRAEKGKTVNGYEYRKL